MTTFLKRPISILLSLLMVMGLFTALPLAVSAESAYTAQIGETKYDTLADAIAAAQDGDTITMIADEELAAESKLIIAAGKNIVLDLNGHTVSGSSSANQFYFITNAGTLEITDSSANEDGKITFTSSKTDFNNERVTIYNLGGTLTLTKGTVENATGGGMAYAINNSSNAWGESVVSTFNMNGGTITAPGGDAALRVYQNTGVQWKVYSKNYVNISGGTILDTGIFVDTVLYTQGQDVTDFAADDITKGCVIDTAINISGGTINGLIDMKIRHPFSTTLNITGGDFTNAKLWVRKYATEYGANTSAGTLAEPTDPMVYISGGRFSFVAGKAFGLSYDCGATSWSTYTTPYEVTGGTFNLVPTFVAEGYKAVDNGDGTYTVVSKYVAQIGETKYESLEAAVAAAVAGDTVTLLSDASVNTGGANTRFPISQSITIDGDGHTITINNRGFGVGMGASGNIDVTFRDVTIENNTAGGRCVDTRGNIGTLILDNATLSTAGAAKSSYDQPLTIGGNQSSVANVIIRNGSEIKTSEDGTMYYAIMTFNPVNMTITDSTIKGWACIYAKGPDSSAGSAGSVFTITDSVLVSKNVSSGTSNAFSMFMVEDNDVTINVTDSQIDVSATGDQTQAICSTKKQSSLSDINVNLGEGNEVTLDGDNAVFVTNYPELSVSGGTFNIPVDEEYCADGFIPEDKGNGFYGVDGPYVAAIGETKYATLEDAVAAAPAGATVTLLADVTYGEGKVVAVWEKCFDLDLNGHTFTTNSNQSITASNNGYKASAICFGNITANPPETVSVSNGTIRTAYGAGIYADGAVIMTLSGLDVKQNYPANVQTTDEYSSAVRLTGNATVIIEDGRYEGKNAIAVSNSGGSVTVNGGTFVGDIFFSQNTSTGAVKTITINGGTFDGNFANPNNGILVITGGTFDVDPSAYVPTGYKVVNNDDETYTVVHEDLFVGHSITLGGDIGVNFFVAPDAIGVDPADIESGDVVVKFDWDDGKYKDQINLADVASTAQGLFKLSCNVVPAHMAHTIHAEVWVNGVPQSEMDDYSVQQYAETILANPSKYDSQKPDELAAVVKEMLNYGAQAQTVFDSQLTEHPALANSNLENYGYAMADVSTDMIDAAIAAANPGHEKSDMRTNNSFFGLSYYGTTVVFLQESTLRHYYTITNQSAYDAVKNDTSFTLDERKLDYGYVMFEKNNIPAAEFDTYQAFTIGDQTYYYSVLDYAKAVLSNTKTSQAEKDLAAATYLYNQAANAYFNA